MNPRWRCSLGFGHRRSGSKKNRMAGHWGYLAEKEVWRYLQPSGYNSRTWQTDGRTVGQTVTGRQQKPRLRMASGDKNYNSLFGSYAETERQSLERYRGAARRRNNANWLLKAKTIGVTARRYKSVNLSTTRANIGLHSSVHRFQ